MASDMPYTPHSSLAPLRSCIPALHPRPFSLLFCLPLLPRTQPYRGWDGKVMV